MRRLVPYLAVLPLALILGGYVIYPLWATFVTSLQAGGRFSLDHYRAFFDRQYTAPMEALVTSLGISLLSVLLAGFVGVSLAFLLNRLEFPGRRLLQTLVLVPISLPPLVGVLSFMFLYGESGIVPRALQHLLGLEQVPFALRGIAGVLAVHTFTMYPFFYMTTATALQGLDPSLEEAARSLGATGWQVWRRVTMPMLTPALVAGSLLVFMQSMASYTAPLLFGVDRTLTMQIYVARTNGDLAMASAFSSVLSMVSIAFLFFMRWYQDRRVYRSLSKGVAYHRAEVRSPLLRWAAMVLSVLGTVLVLLPVFVLVLVSFSVNARWTVQVLPPEYTLENYAAIFSDPRFWEPVRTSLETSFLATVAAALFSVAAAYVVLRLPIRGRGLLDAAIMLPWALPGTVVAINLIAAFNQPGPLTLGRVLVGTFWILPLAYFVRLMPLVFRSTAAALAQQDPSLEEVARSLGATWLYSFRRVVLPLMMPGVLGGALLAFVEGIGEFVASILLYTPDNVPISVEIFRRMYSFEFGTATAYGVLQIVLILIVLGISNRLHGGGRAPAVI
ncbi:ABC transporter permease [Thermaerobacter subterraneus]|uniref:ABC transporter permease n=1 Tax=Thermaerobacter subterraneus TaxID=175696 RepID=UPI0012EAEC61|nr:iron ABC transporter permease [Thermaerobacter subterraneus]